jgi:hypothetical protein
VFSTSGSITLDFDSCSVQDRRTGTMLGAGPRRHDGLWELHWLRLPSDAMRPKLHFINFICPTFPGEEI